MDQPDPAQAASLEDLVWCLRHLRTLADTPTYRELERRTIHAEGVLPGTDLRRVPLRRATIADVLAGHAFPRKAFLLTFAEACGVDLQVDHRWGQAWNRLAVRYQALPANGGQGPDQLAPAVGTTGAINGRIQPEVLADFLEAADAASGSASSLLGRLALREVERVTTFMRQLPTGQEISYDGEDREWLLGLIQETQHSIDAISLSTADAASHGIGSGLWASDLGVRYLELQQEAVERGAAIRRIFVFENESLACEEAFLRVTQMQRDAGIHIRILHSQLIPDLLLGAISDFVIFDDEISYETMAGTSLIYDYYRPTRIRTMLVPSPSRVKALKRRFEQLWVAADPERSI